MPTVTDDTKPKVADGSLRRYLWLGGEVVLGLGVAGIVVYVSVHTPAGTSDGAAVPVRAAWTASTRNPSTSRPCCRQVATTVWTRSTNRLPASLSVP